MVSRLCAPIEGTDAGRLADCLGLDGSKYRAAAAAAGQGETREDASLAAVASLDDDDRWVGGWVVCGCMTWYPALSMDPDTVSVEGQRMQAS